MDPGFSFSSDPGQAIPTDDREEIQSFERPAIVANLTSKTGQLMG